MLRSFREKEFYHPFLVWLMLVCWYAFLGQTLLGSPETKLADVVDAQSFWLLNEAPPEASDVTIVAIDQTSRKQLGRKWPWERSLTATLIGNLAALSPQAIGLDIIFSGVSGKAQDQALVSALKSHPKIVLGYSRQQLSEDRPDEPFAAAASFMGFVDKPVEAGLIRNITTHYRDDSDTPHVSMDVQLAGAGLRPEDVRISSAGIWLKDGVFIPSPNGRTPLNYLVYPTDFRTIPAIQVIKNRVDPADFKDKIVLVGATDPLIHDEHPTILGTLSGVTILGNAVVMLLSERFVHPAPPGSGLVLGLILGCVVLIINKRFGVLRASFLTVGLLIVVYLSFVLLRRLDLTLPYFLILFAGASAFLAFNGYKYISLLYVANKIRAKAIEDPLTGLYAPRYFILQLHEHLKARSAFMFAAIRITHYKQLSVNMDFDQLKRLLKHLGDILCHEMAPHFGKVSASRIYPDTFGVAIKSEILKGWDAFWNRLQHRLCDTWRDSESEAGRITVQGGLVFKPKDCRGKESDLLAQMDRLLKNGKAGTYRFEEFDQAATNHSPAMSRMDMLEFIAFDWEARAKELEDNLRGLMETNAELNRLNWGTLNALARAIDAKSPWTAGHSGRVTQLALTIGRALKLDDDELADLHRAALLHDIGKIAIPAEILDKPGRLTKDEYDIICEHPKRGARILEPIEAYASIIPIVRQHHERFDGNGYPDRLSGTGINKCARILAVADVYDALTSERPYRAGMSHNRAIDIITEGKGTQFDAEVVDTFLRITADKDRALPACPAHQDPETSPCKRPCTSLSHSPTVRPR